MTTPIESTIWYRKWNNIFFTLFLLLFSISCVSCELPGVVTIESYLLLGGMEFLLFYGWIRSIRLLKRVLKGKSNN